ncbi:MAG: hypothetical protein SGBAC_008981 [Bacillariaceae sp.]
MGVVLQAKGMMLTEDIDQYKVAVVQSVQLELEGDMHCDNKNFEQAMLSYRRALALEEQCLGDLHPTTCDLYLQMAVVMGELVIAIYERLLGKFNLKVEEIYTRLANILMDKGEYETALSFYAKSYGIFDSLLGEHGDTKLAMENIRLAASKERGASESMDLIKKAEETFKQRHPSADGYSGPGTDRGLESAEVKEEVDITMNSIINEPVADII